MFALICILWTYWSCQSWAEFQALIDAASRPTIREVMIVLGALVLVCVCGMVWGWSSRETSEGRRTQASRAPFRFWPSAGAVAIGALCLLILPFIVTRAVPSFKPVVARLHGDTLNARDLALQRRGYYEELDVNRMENWQWHIAEDPEGWAAGRNVLVRQRSDFLLTEVVPSVSTILRGAPVRSNRWGMCDRDYEKIKAPDTYRIVLLGASNDQGTGVNGNETYENLVEDRLNREHPAPRYSRYEILNMSVAGDCILQRLLRLEQEGFGFQPDAVIFSIAAVDEQFLVTHLRKALILGAEPPADYREILEPVVRKASVNRTMPGVMIDRRLRPYTTEISQWTWRRFAEQCVHHRVRPLVSFRPEPVDFEGLEPATRSEMIRPVRAAGLEVIDLSSAFDGVADRDTLMLAKWDHHTNALGHRLLADKLYEQLVPLLFGSPSKLQTSRLQKP
jgi:hypothetical protein